MVKHVLVAVDGSEGARRALVFARGLAEQVGAELTALTVVEPPSMLPIGPLEGFLTTAPSPSPEAVARAHQMLTEVAAGFPAERLHVRADLGHPVDALLQIAQEVGADLIVVGARGLNPAQRFLLGSVSDRLVHHADRPVVVVR